MLGLDFSSSLNRRQRPFLQQIPHRLFAARDAITRRRDALEIFFQDHFHGRMRQHQLAQVTLVRRAPDCFCPGNDSRDAAGSLLTDAASGAGHPPHRSAPDINPGSLRHAHQECIPALSSPARNRRASLRASPRSVLTRSPGRFAVSEGATTSHSTPSCLSRRDSPNPHGPPS